MAGLTKGPLAAEVYWRRRLLFLAVALLLVLGLARVLSGGSDATDAGGTAKDPAGTAAQAGAAASVTPGASGSPTVPVTPTPTTAKEVRQAKKAARQAKKVAQAAAAAQAAASAAAVAAAALPDPQGPCSDTDVVITPSVPSPVAGSDLTIDLELRTEFSPACSWKVSSDTVALKLTSGDDDIWSSQQCPAAIPTQDVVLRRAVPTTIQVVWNAKRSDETCSSRTDWALPGFYHVYAAALAGEPTDVQFELLAPSPQTIVKTVAPDTKAKNKNKNKKQAKKNQ